MIIGIGFGIGMGKRMIYFGVSMYETNLRNKGLSTADIDERLIFLESISVTGRQIDIRGNEPRSSASDAVVLSLTTTLDNILLQDYIKVPSGVELVPDGVSKIVVNWTINQEEVPNYTNRTAIERSIDQTNWTEIARVNYPTATYEDADPTLVEDVEYFYRLRAFVGLGYSTYTVPIGAMLNQKYKWFFTGAFRSFVQPEDFTPTLPATFYRDSSNIIQHNMDFSQYTGGTSIYVNLVTGNDTSGDGAELTPYKTIKKAMTIARDGAESSYCIKILSDTVFYRDESWDGNGFTFTNKTIALIPQNSTNKIKLTTGQRSLVWTDDGEGTWKAARSSVYSVFDTRITDSNSLEIPLLSVDSIVNCKAAINTWYTDNVTVYVHTSDGLTPTDSTIIVGILAITNTLLGTSKFYMKNVTILGSGTIGTGINGDVTGSTLVGEFVGENCNFIGGNMRYATTSINSVNFNDVKNVFLFNCKAAYSKKDAFNYHFAEVQIVNRRDCLVIEYNCEGYNSGLVIENNNASTCHEGINIIRFRGNYYKTLGPVIADVQGCYSILIDTNAYDSLVVEGAKIVYQFDNSTMPEGLIEKTIMVNCTNNGETVNSFDLFINEGYDCTLYSCQDLIYFPSSSGQPIIEN